jgi:hypothetical protein
MRAQDHALSLYRLAAASLFAGWLALIAAIGTYHPPAHPLAVVAEVSE